MIDERAPQLDALKKADGGVPAAMEPTERYPQSVVSGLTVEEIRDVEGKRAAIQARLLALGAPRRDVSPRSQPFMLATLGEAPFSREGWLFEIKYDGVRVFARRRDGTVELYGRSGQPVTGRYPDVYETVRGAGLMIGIKCKVPAGG